MNDPLFVIGDVHGCAMELDLLLSRLPLTPRSTIIFVGDYIDRGSQAREVVETILELRRHYRVVTLLGNHEAMLFEFLKDSGSMKGGMFIYNGGSSTLASYADPFGNYSIPDEHLEFFHGLRLYHDSPGFFFVHAGVPEVPLEQIDPEAHRDEMLWSRTMAGSSFRWAKRIVHGHTAMYEPEILPHRINVDTGCIFNNKLTAIDLRTLRSFNVPLQKRAAPTYLRDVRSKRQAIRFEGAIPVTIYIRSHLFRFLTVNYSEIGMYLRCISGYTNVHLALGDVTEGIIGEQLPYRLSFIGEVVRCDDKDGTMHYAIKILSCKDE